MKSRNVEEIVIPTEKREKHLTDKDKCYLNKRFHFIKL